MENPGILLPQCPFFGSFCPRSRAFFLRLFRRLVLRLPGADLHGNASYFHLFFLFSLYNNNHFILTLLPLFFCVFLVAPLITCHLIYLCLCVIVSIFFPQWTVSSSNVFLLLRFVCLSVVLLGVRARRSSLRRKDPMIELHPQLLLQF